ncbi:MAG: hypothetical protein KF795_09315 [Labilithrix sp.]|nr:hypothetical protein [Labilithrix sp.]
MKRLLAELGGRHTTSEVDAALASLTVSIAGDAALIARDAGVALFGEPTPAAAVARVAPGAYTETPTSDARVRVLEAAAAIAPRIEVHAPAVSDGTHRGRLAIDLPRRAARAVGFAAAEPGDRFSGRFVHAFFDDEAILEEAARAGLDFVARRGAWVILDGAARARAGRVAKAERAEPFRREVLRALAIVRRAERLRLANAPERAVRAMRERGSREPARGPVGRARLRRAIGWVDAAYLGGPNCFRRTLTEIALDAGAARETLVFGLDLGRTGHVAFKDSEERTFDVAFEVPPDARPPDGS